ncbi:MAG: FAD binding domain-containing protein, partial [Bacteroidota bacterium]
MKQFEYYSPRIVVETCALLKEFGGEAQILAGGTDVLIELRKPSVKAPKAIININCLSELNGIAETESEIIIKPLVTHTELGLSSLIKKHARLLHMAANVIGSPQIRNRGTIGGNIINAAAC